MSQTVSEMFTVTRGSGAMLLNLTQDDDGVPYISASAKNNGVTARVLTGGYEVCPAYSISVSVNGSILEAFMQPWPYVSASDVKVLVPKRPMTVAEMLWWATCIRANKYRYSYGRKANRTLKSLALPDAIPAWVRNTPVHDLSFARAAASSAETPALHTDDWRSFRYDELFDIKKGTRLTKQDQTDGSTPFVGSSRMSNGVTAHVGQECAHPAACITVSYNGSVAEAFLQPHAFFATDDVNVFYPKSPLTPERALFICTLIRQEAYRYNYGRKWSLEGMRAAKLNLPVTEDGQPDWQWMTDYMRTLRFSGSLLTSAAA
ncbi:MAG: restriction endonuclease subunit S [Solirubrobacteraceae bacterium]